MILNCWAKPVPLSLLFSMIASSLCAQTTGKPIGSAVPKRPLHIYYADPINGSMNGDGSAARPWSTLSAVIAANLINGQDKTSGVVHAGDLLYLLSGHHGSIHLKAGTNNCVNTDFISVQAAPGNVPILDQLLVEGASKWIFRGMTISQTAPSSNSRLILARFSGCDNIVLDKNIVCSQPDVSKWGPSDWASMAAFYGIYFDGTSSTIINNTVVNVENGVYIAGDGIILRSNAIDSFANDGIDFSSNDSIIQYNSVTNHYGQWNDGQHHDGIQGWSLNGLMGSNVVIDSNIVMASTGIYPAIPQPTGVGDDYMQGLSIFDPPWTNVTVTNNVVAAAGYHGLSMYGITNSVIANNTVVNQSSDADFIAWLGVFAVSGVPMSNVIVQNNIANNFKVLNPGAVVDDHNLSFTYNSIYTWSNNSWSNVPSNIVVSDPKTVFVKYQPSSASFDFNLVTGSPAIGAGNAANAPMLDILKRTRNPLRIDLGAYSYVGN
jgi:Right handed beta helix region